MREEPEIKAIKDASPEEIKNASMIRGHAKGALENGTRIVKCKDDPGDQHHIGDEGIIFSSIGPATIQRATDLGDAIVSEKMYGYWVEWDDMKGTPVFIAGNRIKKK